MVLWPVPTTNHPHGLGPFLHVSLSDNDSYIAMYPFSLLLSVTFVSYAMYATITATLELYIKPMFSLLEYIIRSTLLCARRY